jgi:predicted signal transduction protein with EAL and GGDEF domain
VLRRLGCRLAQGYLLGRPLPFDAVEQLVRRGRVAGGPSVVAVPAPSGAAGRRAARAVLTGRG